MGVAIEGAGTSTIRIQGAPKRRAAMHRLNGDYIEAGSWAVVAAITGGDIDVSGVRATDMEPITSVLGTALGLVIVVVTIYVCYRFATALLSKLGDTGTVVMLRLSAFILVAIGVQIFCDGVIEEFHIPIPRGF